jgi:hypothetical protein
MQSATKANMTVALEPINKMAFFILRTYIAEKVIFHQPSGNAPFTGVMELSELVQPLANIKTQLY